MLEEILRHLKNWFLLPDGIHEGIFTIENGGLKLPFLAEGQYYRLFGSLFHDGLHRYGEVLKPPDETFQGTIWALGIPAPVLSLCEEISEWQEKNGGPTPYISESFGGYTYTRATNSQTGQAASWQEVFRSQLNPWRKLREDVPVLSRRSAARSYSRPFHPDYPWR